jgi:hypothetical protein
MVEYNVCPICDSFIATHPLSLGGNVRQCKFCGYTVFLIRVRRDVDVDNDLGRFKFTCFDKPWGYATIITINGGIIETSVDTSNCDKFLEWLKTKENDYSSAHLSCFKDGEIKTINLLDLIQKVI